VAAYYNEIDPYAAQWLRNLIAAGHIAPGDVDERSIVDVRAGDLRSYTQCHFFAGIGGWSLALRLAGFPDDRPVWTGSCPCQPFSSAGKQKGFADQRHLWPTWIRLIAEQRPAILFGEQVASATEWLRLVRGDLEAVEYAVGCMPIEAASAGADHLRDRFFYVGHANGAGPQGWGILPECSSERAAWPSGLEHTASERRGEGRSEHEIRRWRHASAGASGSIDLAHADGQRQQACERCGSDGICTAGCAGHSEASASSSSRDLGVADCARRQPWQSSAARARHRDSAFAASGGDLANGDGTRAGEYTSQGTSRRATGEHCEWVLGADGKARRVKSGIRLLAHGVPNRVGLLRSFGNAIDPRPASEFIRASLEAIGECSMNARAAIAHDPDPILAETLAAFKAREVFPSGHEISHERDSDEKGRSLAVARCECGAVFRLLVSLEIEIDVQVEAHWQRFDSADDRGQPVSEEASRNGKPAGGPDAGRLSAGAANLIARHQRGELCCGNCASWKRTDEDSGECWSSDRLDGDLSKGPAGFPFSTSFCEAWCEKEPLSAGDCTESDSAPIQNDDSLLNDPAAGPLIFSHRARVSAPAGHAISKTAVADGEQYFQVATCECGEEAFRFPPSKYLAMEAAIEAHWQKFDHTERQAAPPAELPEPAGAQPSPAPASAGSLNPGDDGYLLQLAATLAWRDEDEPDEDAAALPVDETAIGRPLLRWHGGKWMLAPWIISHFPPHRVYVEPFGGAASVLLRKLRSYAEVYNDLDDDVVNLFRVLRNDGKRLIELLRLTPFARTEFKASYDAPTDPLERARSLVIRSFMGFGSNGHNILRKTGFRQNSNRSGTTPAQDWKNYPDALVVIKERLTGVVIDNRDACEVMSAHDEPRTLHYVDPPYMPETRALKNPYDLTYAGGMYRHEMNKEDHARVLAHLMTLEGMVVLSGYPHELYDSTLEGWRRVETPAHADGARDRTEVLWLNPACAAAVDAEHPTLFNIAKCDAANTPPPRPPRRT
jgi:DNA adenine methylase